MDQKAIAERLVEMRKKSGRSQTEVAQLASVSRQAVSKWEKGDTSPSVENYSLLASLYGYSVDEIIKGAPFDEGRLSGVPAPEGKTLSERFQFLRNHFKMSQTVAAQRLSVSRQSISKWERGEAIPDIDKLVQICELWDVPLSYLFPEAAAVSDEPSAEGKEPNEAPQADRSSDEDTAAPLRPETDPAAAAAPEASSEEGAPPEVVIEESPQPKAAAEESAQPEAAAEESAIPPRAARKALTANKPAGHAKAPRADIKKRRPAFKTLSDIGPNDPAYVYISKDNGKIRTMLPLLAVIPICAAAVALLIRRELRK